MGYIPTEKLGVIVMSMTENYPPTRIGLYALSLMLNHDPTKELRVFREEEITRRLEGIYETYGGTVRVTIKRQGDYLLIIDTTRYTEEATILVPEEIRYDYERQASPFRAGSFHCVGAQYQVYKTLPCWLATGAWVGAFFLPWMSWWVDYPLFSPTWAPNPPNRGVKVSVSKMKTSVPLGLGCCQMVLKSASYVGLPMPLPSYGMN
jgi:hypothetical protein